MKLLVALASFLLPWNLRRRLLQAAFGYRLHPTSRIGWSWIFPRHLILEAEARIGHLNVCKGLDLLHLGASALIGRGNWITAYPSHRGDHFAAERDRQPVLIVGDHASITSRHLLDCTNAVKIGKFSTLAGFQSQILTHSIDLTHCRQASAPVTIGDYCFVGTNCVLLGGSALPDCCVLGAKSLLNKAQTQTHTLYGGVPARAIKPLSPHLGYFTRTKGFVP